MRLLLIVATALVAECQGIPTAAISPQGQQSPTIIKDFQLIDIVITSPTVITFDGADVYKAVATAGFKYIGENKTKANLNRQVQLSFRNTVAVVGPIVSATGVGLMASNVIKFSPESRPRWETAAITVHAFLDALYPIIKSRIVDPTDIIDNLVLYKGRYSTPFEGYIGAAYPSPGAVVVPFGNK